MNIKPLKKIKDCKFVLDDFFKEYQHEIQYTGLCTNPHAFDFLDEHWDDIKYSMDNIDWMCLCENPNENSFIRFLEKHWNEPKVKKCNWSHLCKNSKSIPFITKFYDEIKDKII